MATVDGNAWEEEKVIEKTTDGDQESKITDGLQKHELNAEKKSEEVIEKERKQALPMQRQVLFLLRGWL